MAVDFIPQGNINLKNTYGIFNATSVNSTAFWQAGYSVLDSRNLTGLVASSWLGMTALNTTTLRNNSGVLDIVYSFWTGLFYTKTEIAALDLAQNNTIDTKLNLTDQRYNDTSSINSVNSSLTTQIALELSDNTTQANQISGLVSSNTSTNSRIDSINSSLALNISGEGLVGKWSLDTNGSTLDETSYANDGTRTNLTWDDSGKFGGAEIFNGQTSDITLSKRFGITQNITIAAWVNPASNTAPAANTRIFEINDAVSRDCMAVDLGYRSNNGSFFSTINACGTTLYTRAFSPNTWYFVVMTFNTTTLNIYVDGILEGTQARTGPMAEHATDFARIGAGHSATGAPTESWNGTIDEVRVYNRSLSSKEINTLFLLGNPDGTNTNGFVSKRGDTMTGHLTLANNKLIKGTATNGTTFPTIAYVSTGNSLVFGDETSEITYLRIGGTSKLLVFNLGNSGNLLEINANTSNITFGQNESGKHMNGIFNGNLTFSNNNGIKGTMANSSIINVARVNNLNQQLFGDTLGSTTYLQSGGSIIMDIPAVAKFQVYDYTNSLNLLNLDATRKVLDLNVSINLALFNLTNATNVSAIYLNGNSSWIHQSYPTACPGSGAITQLGDAVTCSDLWVDTAGDSMTGGITFDNNVGISGKDTSGTVQQIVKLNSANQFILGAGIGTVEIRTNSTGAIGFRESETGYSMGLFNATAKTFVIGNGTAQPFNMTVTGKLIANSTEIPSTSKMCLDGATCSHSITFNGTHTIIT